MDPAARASAQSGLKFLLRFAGWATIAFVLAWFVARPYQKVIASVAARLVAPPGSEIEFVDLELFYPFDIGVLVGLCLASGWATWPRRARAIAIGTPFLVGLEIASLAAAMAVMLNGPGGSSGTPDVADSTSRFASGLIRVTGLISAAGVWFYLLGRERLSLAARTWLGG